MSLVETCEELSRSASLDLMMTGRFLFIADLNPCWLDHVYVGGMARNRSKKE